MNEKLKQISELTEGSAELKEWYRDSVNAGYPGFGNGHEWFAITGIPKDRLVDVAAALKEAEEGSFGSCETWVSEGADGGLVLECNTAKDFDNTLLDHVRKSGLKEDTSKPSSCAIYWQDQWDYPDNLELDPKECELSLLKVEPYDIDSEGYDYWNTEITVIDNRSGAEFDLGGGYISSDQVETLLSILENVPRADGYEEYAPDIGHLGESEEEELE